MWAPRRRAVEVVLSSSAEENAPARALAMVAEVVHGAPYRFSDPARFSLAHGGKDRHPFPVPLRVYDETIRVLKSAVTNAKLGREEQLGALRRLDAQARALEHSAEADLVGLGVSAIGALGPTYSQNHRDLGSYYECLDRGELPIMRGIELTPDDLVRRAVIHGLMCNFALSKEAIEIAYLVDFDRYFAAELGELREFEEGGMLTAGEEWISVSPQGRFMIRSICMVFDKYLRAGRTDGRYSRTI